jgi:hypothetical protein
MASPSSGPSAPVQTDRKPSSAIAPDPSNSKPEVVQERSRGQLNGEAESEGKEDSSSEESLTSDAESTDLQDEARDTFDTSKSKTNDQFL